jgi:hypothetical protein
MSMRKSATQTLISCGKNLFYCLASSERRVRIRVSEPCTVHHVTPDRRTDPKLHNITYRILQQVLELTFNKSHTCLTPGEHVNNFLKFLSKKARSVCACRFMHTVRVRACVLSAGAADSTSEMSYQTSNTSFRLTVTSLAGKVNLRNAWKPVTQREQI